MLSLLESDSDLKKPESKLSTDPELSVSWVMLSWELIQHERVQVCSVYCVECALYIGYYYAQRDNGTWEKIYWILRGNNNFNCVNPEIYVQFCLIKRKKIDIFGTFRRAGHNPHPLIHLEGGGGSIYIVYIDIFTTTTRTLLEWMRESEARGMREGWTCCWMRWLHPGPVGPMSHPLWDQYVIHFIGSLCWGWKRARDKERARDREIVKDS